MIKDPVPFAFVCCFALLLAGIIVGALILDFKAKAAFDKEAANKGVLVNGVPWNVTLIEDRRRGVRLRAIHFDRCLAILPGEEPIPVEARP